MAAAQLDCSAEQCTPRTIDHPSLRWRSAEIETTDWQVPASDAMLAEIDRLARFIAANPLPPLSREIDDFNLPETRATLQRMRVIVDHGVGFAVLDRTAGRNLLAARTT